MNNEYYGIASTPTEDFLAHYGIKGMKWGVRKALQRGNDRALGRQYRKAQKKLAKLERRAESGKKYTKRAAALGAGAAAAGGLAALGTSGIGNLIKTAGGAAGSINNAIGTGMATAGKGINALGRSKNNMLLRNVGIKMVGRGNAINANTKNIVKGMNSAGRAVKSWGGRHNLSADIAKGVESANMLDYGQKIRNAGITNNTIARIGAGTVGAGLAGAAGYNAYRAATTKRAAKKAAQFRSEMNKAFAGTKYANAPRTKKRRK